MNYLRPSDDAAVAIEQVGEWLSEASPRELVIETSGSTGAPKRVVLSRAAVLASAEASARWLSTMHGLKPGRWALLLPSSYVAGVNVIVRSLLAGAAPVVGGWADQGGEAAYTSLVPTQLHRMLQSEADLAALRRMRAVLVGGGWIDPALRRRAEDAGVRVVATYGSSETSGGCVYDGLPLDGVGLVIAADGRIRLGGPTLFDRYEGDPELTSQALVDGWYLTSDAGRLDEDGRLQVLGRLDDVVVSGGVKVPLPAVTRRLLEHRGIAAAETIGVSDEEWGQRVVAFVVADEAPTLDELRDWVSGPHPRSWAPRQVVVLEVMPLLANGKVDMQALRELVR